MGSMFKTPKPAEDPELKKRKAEQKRINEEEAARHAFKLAAAQLPFKGNFVKREVVKDEQAG